MFFPCAVGYVDFPWFLDSCYMVFNKEYILFMHKMDVIYKIHIMHYADNVLFWCTNNVGKLYILLGCGEETDTKIKKHSFNKNGNFQLRLKKVISTLLAAHISSQNVHWTIQNDELLHGRYLTWLQNLKCVVTFILAELHSALIVKTQCMSNICI